MKRKDFRSLRENVGKIASILTQDIDTRIYTTEFYIATDVTNPLFGKMVQPLFMLHKKGQIRKS
jgi:glycerate kinase